MSIAIVYVNFPYFLFSVVNAFSVYLYCVAFSHVRLLHVNKGVSQSVSHMTLVSDLRLI